MTMMMIGLVVVIWRKSPLEDGGDVDDNCNFNGLLLTDLVYHVDIIGIVDVKNWAFRGDGEEAHEHECSD